MILVDIDNRSMLATVLARFTSRARGADTDQSVCYAAAVEPARAAIASGKPSRRRCDPVRITRRLSGPGRRIARRHAA